MNTLERPPYKVTINLDECVGIFVIENGEEMDIREYIRRIVKDIFGKEIGNDLQP